MKAGAAFCAAIELSIQLLPGESETFLCLTTILFGSIKIKEIIESTGNSSSWFQNLVSHRNMFIHEAAPYLAVDISKGASSYDLLIMKENIKTFEDKSKYINMSEINAIIEGFLVTKPVIQKYLIDLYKELP